MLGLANLLRRYGVTYEALEKLSIDINNNIPEYTPADELARKLEEGIERAARIAKNHNMVRSFAIAPTASV